MRGGKKKYGNRKAMKNRQIGLNRGHQHKFRQHITGEVYPPSHTKCILSKPLKEYQFREMKYYPHPIQQKILLLGNQDVITGSDNILSDKVDYENFPEVEDSKLLSTVYFPITGSANWSGIQSHTRMQVDANSEGFSKVSVLGRQNRCNEKYAYPSNGSESEKQISVANQVANPDEILTSTFLSLKAQANRNFAVKITCVLIRLSATASITQDQGLTNDELVECMNNQTHIDYDTAEILVQQSKILQPCRSEKYVNQDFELGWKGYYKLTQEFRDETALTLKADQGGTFKYGQQAKSKIAGSAISQDALSNRLCWIIKAKRLGTTMIGSATQEVEYTSGTRQKKIGITMPFNQEDSDSIHGTIAHTSTDTALNQFIDDDLKVAGFRCKCTITNNYHVKEGVRNIPVYVNSSANNGQTQILHASTYDSNYGTINATLNKTD